MQTDSPESEDSKFRIKVGATCLALSALIGSLHGQIASDAQARRADPDRVNAAIVATFTASPYGAPVYNTLPQYAQNHR